MLRHTVIKHQQSVTFFDRCWTVRHNQHRLPFGLHAADRLVQGFAAFVVEVLVWLVQNKNHRRTVKRPGQTDALQLTTRQQAAVGTDAGVVAIGEL